MHTIAWLKKFNITIARLNDSEIMLGYTKERSQWTPPKPYSYRW